MNFLETSFKGCRADRSRTGLWRGSRVRGGRNRPAQSCQWRWCLLHGRWVSFHFFNFSTNFKKMKLTFRNQDFYRNSSRDTGSSGALRVPITARDSWSRRAPFWKASVRSSKTLFTFKNTLKGRSPPHILPLLSNRLPFSWYLRDAFSSKLWAQIWNSVPNPQQKDKNPHIKILWLPISI